MWWISGGRGISIDFVTNDVVCVRCVICVRKVGV